MEMRSDLLYDIDGFVISKVDGIPILTINITRPSIKEVNEFKANLNMLLSTHSKKIIIDFSNCNFADSVIIGAMVSTHKELQEIGGSIIAITTKGQMDLLFGQTGLDRVIKNFHTREEALASFSF